MYDDLDTVTRDAAPPSLPPSPPPVIAVKGPSTADDVLDLDEARRTLIFGGFLLLLIVAVTAGLFIVGGDRTARWIHIGGLATVAVTALWFRIVARDPASYRAWHNVVLGHACVVAITTGFYFWGPFSAALLIIPFGAFIFSASRNLGGALSVTVHLVVMHVGLSVAFLTGAVDDHTVVSASHLPRSTQVVILVLINALFLATFVVARQLRASSRAAIEQLDRALRALGQREAQLAEARRDLRDAVIGGGRGRFSNHVVGGYRLGALRGRGGMGEVYEAEREDGSAPGQRFAVKLLHPHLLSDPSAYERFAREARSAAALDSPHVVRVVDVSPDAAAMPFLAMELLEGHDLAMILRERPTLPPAEVATLLRQIGAGLEAAHAAGIVHRDLKPQNVFAARTGRADDDVTWKILDFGVSKLATGEGSLSIGHAVGTPSYMSPEQARGDAIDHRSDLYSLGVIAYRALTGRPAVASAEVMTMLHDVCHRMPPQPSAVADLAGAIDDVLLIALAKAPGERFASGRELADALAAAAHDKLSLDLQLRAAAVAKSWNWARVRDQK
ncbi:MAG TPA: serine/threonine-protein kinase [Kofleriaceae bacterium]|nr:serine/threonine-protein kinase [Kofleriaceae bacterium]